jgi:hypothetical protein
MSCRLLLAALALLGLAAPATGFHVYVSISREQNAWSRPRRQLQ